MPFILILYNYMKTNHSSVVLCSERAVTFSFFHVKCLLIESVFHFRNMKDRKGNSRGKCLKLNCDCDDYTVEKDFCLCAYCEHTPAAHGNSVYLHLIIIITAFV